MIELITKILSNSKLLKLFAGILSVAVIVQVVVLVCLSSSDSLNQTQRLTLEHKNPSSLLSNRINGKFNKSLKAQIKFYKSFCFQFQLLGPEKPNCKISYPVDTNIHYNNTFWQVRIYLQ